MRDLEAFEQLKRVLGTVPPPEFAMGRWQTCACGHATRDAWFQERGFSECYTFAAAAAFFKTTKPEARALFGPHPHGSPQEVIAIIDQFLETDRTPATQASSEFSRHARRQVIIDRMK